MPRFSPCPRWAIDEPSLESRRFRIQPVRRDGCVLLIQLRLDGSTGSIGGIFFPAHGILSKEANLVELRKARISVDCFVSVISVFFHEHRLHQLAHGRCAGRFTGKQARYAKTRRSPLTPLCQACVALPIRHDPAYVSVFRGNLHVFHQSHDSSEKVHSACLQLFSRSSS